MTSKASHASQLDVILLRSLSRGNPPADDHFLWRQNYITKVFHQQATLNPAPITSNLVIEAELLFIESHESSSALLG